MDDELYHYGVLGMKWGVRRATSKAKKNEKLKKKALDYDYKSAVNTRRAERAHARKDLGRSTTLTAKAARNRKKALKLEQKAQKTDNDFVASKLHRKAQKLNYTAAKREAKGNRLSKSIGYGPEAMKWSIRSDRFAAKAAKARYQIANNEYYIERLKRKISTISQEDLNNGYSFVNDYLKRQAV